MATKRGNGENNEGHDLSKGERGKFFRKHADDVVLVELDPDVARRFPNAKAVNAALRALAAAMDVVRQKQPA